MSGMQGITIVQERSFWVPGDWFQTKLGQVSTSSNVSPLLSSDKGQPNKFIKMKTFHYQGTFRCENKHEGSGDRSLLFGGPSSGRRGEIGRNECSGPSVC